MDMPEQARGHVPCRAGIDLTHTPEISMDTPTGTQPPDPSGTRTGAAVAQSAAERDPSASPPVAPNEGPADDPATGHNGPGYGDPKRHYGNDPPPAGSSSEGPPQPPDDNPAAG
jgi:hypothetical protein